MSPGYTYPDHDEVQENELVENTVDNRNAITLVKQEEYGASNALTVVGGIDEGNSSQFLIVRRAYASQLAGSPCTAPKRIDWCIVVGNWELDDIAVKASALLGRMETHPQSSYSMGNFGPAFVRMSAKDNKGSWKLEIHFEEQTPMGLSEGSANRWVMHFTGRTCLVDFLKLLSKIKFAVGRFAGYLPHTLWPLPYTVPNLDRYAELAVQVRAADRCQELECLVDVLYRISNGDAVLENGLEKTESAVCLKCTVSFLRPRGQSWCKLCKACWFAGKDKQS